MSLPEAVKCTGCGLCESACNADAITMGSDNEGFHQPVINEQKCIHCQKCERLCPVLNPAERVNTANPEVYACWNNETETRKSSTSGGIYSAIAGYILENGGQVFASCTDTPLTVSFEMFSDSEGVAKARGSKYVQSYPNKVYRRVASCLAEGHCAFFVGCSCQVSALYSYLEGTDVSALFTADLVCHGVASDNFFEEYINWREKESGKKILFFSARDKSNGWNNLTVKLEFEDGSSQLFESENDPFMRAYYAGLTYRNCCYECPYSKLPRTGDVTLGDYFAVTKDNEYADQIHDGISMVLVNNDKGKALLNCISDNITCRKRELSEAISTNECLVSPMKRHKNRKRFFAHRKHYMRLLILNYCPRSIKFVIAKMLGERLTKIIKRFKQTVFTY